MRLRCFMFDYTRSFDNVDDRFTIKWVEDHGNTGGQIVAMLHLPDGRLEWYGHLPGATMYLPGILQLIEAGLVVELS